MFELCEEDIETRLENRIWPCKECQGVKMLCGGCSDVDAKDACCVPWMVSISKDCSIAVVLLDLTFRTTNGY